MSIYLAGVIGGLASGVVFGVMMGMMKMLPMIAKLFGSDSASAGFVIHLFFSAIIGLVYVLTAPAIGVGFGAVSGLIYGLIWWILGANIIMPAWLKMKATWSMLSLMGHLVYGLLLGLVVSWLL